MPAPRQVFVAVIGTFHPCFQELQESDLIFSQAPAESANASSPNLLN